MISRSKALRDAGIPIAFVLALIFASASLRAAPGATATPVDGYKVIATYPHSTESYTEGFFYRNGLFYEGTGLNGRSQLLVIQPESGKVLQHHELPEQYFGEGIVDWGSNLYEWTWQSHVCFVYDQFSLRLVKQFTFGGEGWGMTRTAKELITSDGSATLTFRNPETFQETRRVVVKDGAASVTQLNELEFIPTKTGGEIYANVWHSDRIARISPKDGHVIGWIDLTGILPESQMVNAESVLNGIAYDAQKDRLFVTGKQWPKIFEIKIVPHGPGKAGH
jgi:glutaminyl-peptide cyclotransferase